MKLKDSTSMILDFLKTSANLKKIPRQGWIDKLDHKNPETVAEHTYLMSMMGMVFSDIDEMNTGKILKMILLHDLAESIIGDMTPEMLSEESKKTLENDAMEKILKYLPEPLYERYKMLWDEFQANSSDESKLVHQIDKLEMALQAKIYSEDGFKSEQLSPFFKTAKDTVSERRIKEMLEKIMKDID